MKKNADGNATDEHKASVIGDTVGDPLKDTSGPAIMKLSAITSLIFANFIATKGGLIIGATTFK
jgi:K(+)-stimulated pyrophosphate-energized sodium pump